jgi:hypothetical protein
MIGETGVFGKFFKITYSKVNKSGIQINEFVHVNTPANYHLVQNSEHFQHAMNPPPVFSQSFHKCQGDLFHYSFACFELCATYILCNWLLSFNIEIQTSYLK